MQIGWVSLVRAGVAVQRRHRRRLQQRHRRQRSAGRRRPQLRAHAVLRRPAAAAARRRSTCACRARSALAAAARLELMVEGFNLFNRATSSTSTTRFGNRRDAGGDVPAGDRSRGDHAPDSAGGAMELLTDLAVAVTLSVPGAHQRERVDGGLTAGLRRCRVGRIGGWRRDRSTSRSAVTAARRSATPVRVNRRRATRGSTASSRRASC